MADMGFLPEVRRLLDTVRADRQTLLFSATLDGDVDVLVRRFQRAPVRHQVAPEPDARHSRHVFWRAERSERGGLVAGVVARGWPAIVVCPPPGAGPGWGGGPPGAPGGPPRGPGAGPPATPGLFWGGRGAGGGGGWGRGPGPGGAGPSFSPPPATAPTG